MLFALRTSWEVCLEAGPAAEAMLLDVVALAAAAWPDDVGGGGVGGCGRLGLDFLRDSTLTNAYSISDEKTNTRHTIIQMSIICFQRTQQSVFSSGVARL